MRILIAEDSPVNLMLIEKYLKDPVFELDTAGNGAVAFQKFQSGDYDLVLMDLQMPVMDGYAATRTMRAWEAEHQKRPTPILALTAHAFKEEQEKSLAAGCNAHLIKPIRKPDLLEAIRQHTGSQEPASLEVIGTSAVAALAPGAIRVRPPAGIEEAVPLFLDITRQDLQSLCEALRAQDYPKIRFIGHDLKGSGGGYGFEAISTLGRSIEEAAKRSDGEEIGKHVSALADYLERVEVVYD
ncbi:MAG TPA: response regulator [Bryobacteraceae bacterium]|jgi:CheY-like chemotaxis protein|nr:response regulator [Bryobacteraceae bacterium]